MDILDIFLDILLKPPQPLVGLFFEPPFQGGKNEPKSVPQLLRNLQKVALFNQMTQKQSASSPHAHILVAFILKWEKKTSLHLEIISFIVIFTPKRNETVQKLFTKLFTKINK